MNTPEIIYKYSDKIIKPLISLLVPSEDISRRLNIEKRHFQIDNHDYILEMLSTIHERASAMVSHLSLMLGVCLFLMQAEIFKKNSWIEQLIVILDVLIYITLVILTVRCLRSFSLDKDYVKEGEYWQQIHTELVFKYSIMQVVNSFTIVATVVLVVALVFSINV